jgi:preprotein translocase subunit SecB
MADATTNTPAPAAAGDAPQPIFNLEKVYVKDMSIEVPNAPEIFLEQESPTLETQLNIDAKGFSDNMVDISVTATVTTRVKDKVVFLVEVVQAGIFQVSGIPPEQMDALIGIHGAATVYPYLRANVADQITRAGFPPLHLPQVNFEALYAQRMAEAQAQQAGAAAEPAKH